MINIKIEDHQNAIAYSALLLIVSLCGYLVFLDIGKLSFWLDEAFTYFASTGNLKDAIKKDPNMSLYNLLAHAWIQIIPNHSEGMLRALSAIFSIASIPIIYLLGGTLTFSRKKGIVIGLISASLVATNPFFITYAQEFRSYSLTFFLTTLSTYLFIKSFSQGDAGFYWKVFYTIVASASVYSHFHSILIICAHFAAILVFLVSWGRNRGNLISAFYMGMGITLFSLPILYIAYNKGPGQIGWLGKPDFTSLFDFLDKIANGKIFLAVSLLCVIIALFFSEGVKKRREGIIQWRILLIFGCFLIPVAAVFLISLYYIPIFENRYLLFVMPYLALLTAAGLLAFYIELWKFKYLRPLAGILLIIMGYFFFSHAHLRVGGYFQNKYKYEDWRSASQYLADECSDGLRLYYRVKIPVYYYRPDLRDSNDVILENIISQTSNPHQIALTLPKNYTKACVVISHARDKSKLKLIQEALYILYPKATGRNFPGIRIILFSKN